MSYIRIISSILNNRTFCGSFIKLTIMNFNCNFISIWKDNIYWVNFFLFNYKYLWSECIYGSTRKFNMYQKKTYLLLSFEECPSIFLFCPIKNCFLISSLYMYMACVSDVLFFSRRNTIVHFSRMRVVFIKLVFVYCWKNNRCLDQKSQLFQVRN